MQETLDTLPTELRSELSPDGRELSSMPIPLPLQPTAAYLAVAHSPSFRAAYPNAPRKLLILDLNGTLLVRPKRRNTIHRQIHLRPYMPTFRSYLFHEAVKPWLEVMIWSSAQPHNVNAMVHQSFQGHRNDLKTIWARDTLGLDSADYSRKVQTVKDLQKRWSALPDSSPRHNAETTLLVDDSSLKAHLQPYNHLCVPEYTQNVRIRDLTTKVNLLRQEDLMEEAEVEAQVQSIFPGFDSDLASPTKKKRKRKKYKTRTGFDPTLLAVVGVLDEVRDQTNVAGWVRAGGLWAGRGPPPSQRGLSIEGFQEDERGAHASDLFFLNHERDTRSRIDSDVRFDPPVNPGNDAELGEDHLMWFNHEPSFQYWVERGTHAVETLGIHLDHGLI